jgi:hypothetical protein
MVDGPSLYLYLNNDPTNKYDLWGLAYLGARALQKSSWLNFPPFQHHQFFYSNGENSGYHQGENNKGKIRPDDPELLDWYTKVPGCENLNDIILCKAENNVYDNGWLKNKFGPFHNCQDYSKAVLSEYRRLMKKYNNANKHSTTATGTSVNYTW